MKTKITRINIPEPCSENWAAMTPDDQGKHCGKCSKTVVDFTAMSDAGIVNYLKEHPKACGRFNSHQLERDLLVYPEGTKWYNRFSKVAISVLLFSQLFPKKAAAQNVLSDTIIKRSINNENALALQTNYKRFKGKLTQPDSQVNKAVKLIFAIGEFRLEMACDSLKQPDFNFQIPDSLKDNAVSVELMANDTIYHFEISSGAIPSAYQFFPAKTQSFYYDKGWKHIVISESLITALPYEVVMGIPPIQPFQLLEIKNINCETRTLGFTSLDPLVRDSFVQGDTSWKQLLLKEKMEYRDKVRKGGGANWWIVLSFVFTLSFLIRWFFMNLYSRVKGKNQV